MQTEGQVATTSPQTKQTNKDSLPIKAATIRIHYRHLLLFSPKSNTHFTMLQRVKGWQDLGNAVTMCPRLSIAVTVYLPMARFDPGISHTAVGHVITADASATATSTW